MPLTDLFELEMLGGNVERRFRAMRPEVERLPWGTIDVATIPREILENARRTWTAAAFQEHRTAMACSATLRVLLEIRAPVDLIAMATRFPLDELVHVELCSRMAMELGGGTELRHTPDMLVVDPDRELPPVVRAADLIVRCFCVGEALSIPMLRGAWHAARHPLPRAVLGRIVKDEAAHGVFGFIFLDWILPELDETARAQVGRAADLAIASIKAGWAELRSRPEAPVHVAHPLGWMETPAYLSLASRSLAGKVIEPLRARGIPISSVSSS